MWLIMNQILLLPPIHFGTFVISNWKQVRRLTETSKFSSDLLNPFHDHIHTGS